MSDNVLALDVGDRRIGVAVAQSVARLPRPLTTLNNDEKFEASLQAIIDQEGIGTIVVGLPRNLHGQDTAQTKASRAFAEQLTEKFNLPVVLQDEAGTSRQAETELQARGKPYAKADIDAWAAAIILEDYLNNEGKK